MGFGPRSAGDGAGCAALGENERLSLGLARVPGGRGEAERRESLAPGHPDALESVQHLGTGAGVRHARVDQAVRGGGGCNGGG